MLPRRSARLFAVALLVVAMSLQAFPAHAGVDPVVTPVTSTTRMAQSTSPTLYCGFALDKICRIVCPHCASQESTPSERNAFASTAAPKLTCSRQFEEVCSLVFGVLCTLRPNACPRAASRTLNTRVAAPRWMCVPELETVCYVAGLVLCHFHNCYAIPTALWRADTSVASEVRRS